ncbi:MAG: hemerythrin domain-containing protein [Sphingorhabdus sp.]
MASTGTRFKNDYFKSNGKNSGLIGAAAAGLAVGLVANLARKAVVQGVSASAGEWDDTLVAEHKAVLKLFDQIEATNDEQAGKRKMLIVKVKHALMKHAVQEENVVYPVLREHGMADDADELNSEHGVIKYYLYELAKIDAASPAWMAKARDFRRELEEHMQVEEADLFPKLRGQLGEEGNHKITKLMNKEGFMVA